MKKINCTSCSNTHCFIQQHCSPEIVSDLKKFQMTFKQGQIYPISAVAMEDSLTCFIKNDELYKIFMANPKFTVGLMMFYSRELLKVKNRIKNIAQMNTREKVADALLMIVENFGLNEQNELDASLTREDVANTIGTNTEQISRQISDFEAEGLIAKKGRKIAILNQEGLRKIISAHNPKMIKKQASVSPQMSLFKE